MDNKKNEVTQILKNIDTKNRAADLYPIVYDNLHGIAEKLYRREASWSYPAAYTPGK